MSCGKERKLLKWSECGMDCMWLERILICDELYDNLTDYENSKIFKTLF